MAEYKITATCPEKIIMRYDDYYHHDYSERDLDREWSESPELWEHRVPREIQARCKTREEALAACKAAFLATLKEYTHEEVLQAAKEGYSWPLEHGFVEVVKPPYDDGHDLDPAILEAIICSDPEVRCGYLFGGHLFDPLPY